MIANVPAVCEVAVLDRLRKPQWAIAGAAGNVGFVGAFFRQGFSRPGSAGATFANRVNLFLALNYELFLRIMEVIRAKAVTKQLHIPHVRESSLLKIFYVHSIAE